MLIAIRKLTHNICLFNGYATAADPLTMTRDRKLVSGGRVRRGNGRLLMLSQPVTPLARGRRIYIYIYIWRFAEGADLLMCTISDNFLYIFNHVCVLLCFLCVLFSSYSYLQNIDPMWDRWPPEKLSGWICAETRKRSSYVIVFGEPAFDANRRWASVDRSLTGIFVFE